MAIVFEMAALGMGQVISTTIAVIGIAAGALIIYNFIAHLLNKE